MKKIIYLLSLFGLFACGEKPSSNPLDAFYVTPQTYELSPPVDQAPVRTGGATRRKKESAVSANTAVPISPLIYTAQKVIDTEARQVGTSCSTYVRRVLEVAGFPQGFFVANNFNEYAQKSFKRYESQNFSFSGGASEQSRLRDYIWSHPEREPFILQWIRPGQHGHVAFVERVGDQLVIYQASLNSELPNRDQTRVQSLLSRYRQNLIIYSGMNP